ncbi:MazG-like family protein [Streptomyces virginiae]|uniref:MazG-like family protein n=1 Tax=Streptomyces virginiae TaxID=1961 RepID=UPI00386AD2A2
MKVETREHVTRLRKWLDTNAAPTLAEDAWLLRMLKISEELGEVAEALHGTLGVNPREGASHDWGGLAQELADVIVTAVVALDTVSGDGAAVVEHQLRGRAPDEITAAGDIRLLQVLAINGDMGEGAIAVYGALGTGPYGEAVEVTHTWEDVEARVGRLIRKAAAALDDLTGDARDRVDERLRFLAARVAARAGLKLADPLYPLYGRARTACRAGPSVSSLALRTRTP